MNFKQRIRRNQQSNNHPRGGVAAVEGAIVLSVFLLILLGMLDLGLLLLEYNTLCEATRRLARAAIVHGQMAAPAQTVWGPAAVSGTAADGTEYSTTLDKELATFNLSNVNYSIQWPAGTNRPDDPVQVTVTYQYPPIIPFLLGSQTIPIQAVSNMSVQH
ncbi:MAG TPA: TadE/TadG family type IV pilus assembly protein [Planctomycetaceae bacterium]|jgi:Flp pilus assembly protein TadG|nr:TadE/TadG family type IV pilus assembly protein [Planctomycetaceae bacterium]